MSIGTPIFNMFGRSPIAGIERHIDLVYQACALLIPFYEAVLTEDWPQAERHLNAISDLETDADNTKRDLRLHLPNSLFMPVARSDVLELITVQDQIANKAQDIAGLIFGRQMRFPPILQDDFRQFLAKSIATAKQAHQAINELDELLETGFKGQEVKIVETMLAQIDSLEHESDKLQMDIRLKLFKLETSLPPIDVIFLYKLIDRIGGLADVAQTTGGRLAVMLAS